MSVPLAKRLVVAVATVAVFVGAGWLLHRGQADDSGSWLSEAELFYAPTAPLSLERVVPETAVAAALVVAMPEVQVLGNARKEKFFLRLIEVAARYVPVVVIVNRDEPFAIVEIEHLIRREVREANRVLDRISFVRGLIDSEWVRDYGPVFGVSLDGELVLLDNAYRDVRSEARTERMLSDLGLIRTADGPLRTHADADGGAQTYLSDYGYFWRRNDDAAPLYINEIVHRLQGRFAPLVRPPLQLAGGDLAFAEGGHMITSTRTLELNGGDERRFSRVAKAYFNTDRVTYLRPLPHGMWHLDMLVKFVHSGAVLLGYFPDSIAGSSNYLRQLQREAAEVLEWNRALIEERFPGIEIIRVPMPPPIESPQNALTRAGRTGHAELDAALEATGRRAKYLAPVLYRSFLNSVFIDGGHEPSAVLIPRFSGLGGMEGPVAVAYRRAFPGAAIHFIEADVMAEEFAGIHCVTLVVPDLEFEKASDRAK